MITLNEYLGGKVNKRNRLIPRDTEELRSIIEQRLKESPDLDLNDIDVSKIEDMKELFSGMNISSVDISSWDIDVINDRMFYGCKKLKSVILPDPVKSIGDSTFCRCSKLTDINIPNSVESIGASAFEFCSSLTKIIIPYSVESIGDWAFNDCNKLIEINIPDSVKSIGAGAFYNISHITYHGSATWKRSDKYWGAKRMN